ncbi:ABC transporter permease [Dyadobacter luticola]|uniref:FtsX-like permease family protein n=1 Tax=Dyadobacter luticola TaxID=1979387 RepID=A0A5R9L4E7_9BACT|nr:ABC transporter permease [Dyadobacter luticola]TLV03446.1 FtsX-like permease family protein [Dyadobacter luticola]
MIKNYITIGYRNFRKGHVYSFINLAGLAVGLSSVMLIIAYITYELSFDKHFPHADRIYQMVMESEETSPAERTTLTPEPLGKTLAAEFFEVESSTALYSNKMTYLVNDRPVELNAIFVNPDFFRVFDLRMVTGNKATALKDESGIVLTRQAAEKLYPGVNPVGKTMSWNSYNGSVTYYTVTAVVQDIPANTHFTGDAILARHVSNQPLNFQAYSSVPQYIRFKPNADVARVEASLQKTLTKYHLSKTTHVRLLPLTDIHLRAGKISSFNLNLSDIRYIYMLGTAALLILVIACINYVNLTTAHALQRVKEVGIRKTLGSGRWQLASQFIGESFLFFVFANVLAVVISILLLPVFNKMLQVNLLVSSLFAFQNISLFFIIALAAGLLSGVYPALFLSRMQPASILKDRSGGLKISFSLRKVLIVFQFGISIVLIVATMIVWQQLNLFHNRPLGFNKQHLLLLPSIHLQNSPEAFKKKLLDNPNITAASFAELDLGGGIGNSSSMPDPLDSTRRLHFGFVYADMDFPATMGIKVEGGRSFSKKFPGDYLNYDSLVSVASAKSNKKLADELLYQNPIVITQSLAKALRLKNPVNEVIRLGALQGTVIGVVRDFQVTTLKEASPLLVYKPKKSWFSTTTYVRVNNRNIPESIAYIEKTWKEFFPDKAFEYTFADDNLQKLYASENRLASIFTSFALLAIAISALGLFSLAALMVKQRTKEIGIRKVLGASVSGIAMLLSRDFILLILVAAIIASPLAWYGMEQWLQDFANRIDIQWTIFIAAASLALFIGVLTVFLQTIRAAKSNPIEALKTE